MAKFWSPVFDEVARIATGATGSGRVVPASTFRADLYPVDLGAEEYPALNVDRTIRVTATGGGTAVEPAGTPYASNEHSVATCNLVVAYLYDLEAPEVPTTTPGGGSTERARRRAADDAVVILRALKWAGNYSTLANGVTLVSIEPAGRWGLDDRGNGVLLLVVALLVRVAADPATAWELGE